MGKTFKYIDDEVLQKRGLPGHCPLCETDGLIYSFQCDVNDPNVDVDVVDEACASCIRTVQFDFSFGKRQLNQVRAMINSHYPKGALSGAERRARAEAILAEFQRTPDLPSFVQEEDWPHCCGDYCEYIGEPHSAAPGDLDHYQYWQGGPGENPSGETIYDLTPHERLAVLGGVSGFRCNACGHHYWTFQCT